MKTLDQNNTRIFCQLIERMQGGTYLKIESEPFVPLYIEKLAEGINIAKYKDGSLYSLAHYYTQNGDLMSDPEMTFIVVTGEAGLGNPETVQILPCSFAQSNMGVYEESVRFCDQIATEYDTMLQIDHTEFAGIWLTNIEDQGFLDQK